MRNYILKKLKDLKRYFLARNFMRQCRIIEVDGSKIILSRKYTIKDLFSLGCYSMEELKKMSLPDLMYEYVAQSSGGTEVYDRGTGRVQYVGYIS